MSTRQRAPRLYGEPHSRTTDRWRARVRVNGVETYLGTFATKAEADQVEDAYRAEVVAQPADDWSADLERAARRMAS